MEQFNSYQFVFKRPFICIYKQFHFTAYMPELQARYIRFSKIFFFLVTGISIVFRFFQLGRQSFWLDEIYTAKDAAENLGFKEVLENAVFGEHHPPLYFLLLNGFLKLTHLSGEIGFRSLSLLFALSTIWVLFEIGKKLNQGLLFASFIALYSTSHICFWFSFILLRHSFRAAESKILSR